MYASIMNYRTKIIFKKLLSVSLFITASSSHKMNGIILFGHVNMQSVFLH